MNPDSPTAVVPGENPEGGNDDDPDSCFTSNKVKNPWWSVDLGKTWEVTAVHIKACAESRMLLYSFKTAGNIIIYFKFGST